MNYYPIHQTTDVPRTRYHWYAVHCKPLKEWQAATALEDRLGLTVYLPQIRRRFRGRYQQAPFFPRYLFVRANLHVVPLSQINATPGVLRLVTLGETPQPIPAVVIEELRQRVDSLNAHGGLIEHGFLPDSTVRLKGGPLRGLEAVFIGPMKPSERVRVLIDFLGHHREVEVDVDILERANAGPAPTLERRTRGKGRRITKHRTDS